MSEPENTEENVEKLATHIVEYGMDVSDLMLYVKTDLERHYKNDREAFKTDWENCFE